MSTAPQPDPSADPNAKYIPPDPGGRSRYLVRCIAVAILICAAIAVILMIVLRQQTPPPTPQQQPQSNSSTAQHRIHA